MKLKCCVCGRERDEETCVTIVLTPNEKKHLESAGETSVESLSYCRPCYRTLSDREAGAQLMKGVVQFRLRAAGVPNAEQLAQRFYEFLISKSGKKAH
jgi:hypothetical protein